MEAEKDKLENSEKQTSLKVEEFRSKKEVIKAQYSAAEASVKIKESVTGISEQMNDVGMAMSRAEDKAEKMKAKAQALDEMIDSGVLTDYISNKDDIESELEKTTIRSSVDEELAKLKAERDKSRKKTNKQEKTEQKEENKIGQDKKVEEGKEEQVMVSS